MTFPAYPIPGHSDVEVARFSDYKMAVEITPDDLTAGVYKLALPQGSRVLNVICTVLTAFNGTSPTVKVGDADDDDGFLTTTDLDVETAGAMAQSQGKFTYTDVASPDPDTLVFNGYAQGKAYPSAPGLLLVTFDGAPTTGKLLLEVLISGYSSSDKPSDMINNW